MGSRSGKVAPSKKLSIRSRIFTIYLSHQRSNGQDCGLRWQQSLKQLKAPRIPESGFNSQANIAPRAQQTVQPLYYERILCPRVIFVQPMSIIPYLARLSLVGLAVTIWLPIFGDANGMANSLILLCASDFEE